LSSFLEFGIVKNWRADQLEHINDRLQIGRISFAGITYGPEHEAKSPYVRVLESLLRSSIADQSSGDYALSLFLLVGGTFEREPIRTGVGRSSHHKNIRIVSTNLSIDKEMFNLQDEDFMREYSSVLFAGMLKMEKYLKGKKLASNIAQIQEIAQKVITSYLEMPVPFEMSENEMKMLAFRRGEIYPSEVFRPELYDGKVGNMSFNAAMEILRRLGRQA
jgi:hypothetical protein